MSPPFSGSIGVGSSQGFSSCGNFHRQLNISPTISNQIGEYPSSSSALMLSSRSHLMFDRSLSSTSSTTSIHTYAKYPRNADEFDYYRELKLEKAKKYTNNRMNKNQFQEIRFPDRFSVTEKAVVQSTNSLSGVTHDSSLDLPSDYDDRGKFEKEQIVERPRNGGGRQMMNRSNVIAKQVISIQSALSLGYVSQLWIDTNAWAVFLVEVRPNLFSGEIERCFLEDIKKVGDVLLVEDESVLDNAFKLVGLETLVGYSVVTPNHRNIGKVRGYTFDINSGSIETLELDSFGLHLIPSSLVSTYALYVEDVLEVSCDTVVVHEAAASRVHRLSKGIWGTQSIAGSNCEFEEYSEKRGHCGGGGGRLRKNRSQKEPRNRKEWQMPMDYL